MENTQGYIIDDDMHWLVNCPNCETEIEFTGFFDNQDVEKCIKCKCEFMVNELISNEKNY